MALDTSTDQQTPILYEKEVQTYLSKNLHLLGEASLKLVQVEYPIKFGNDSGRIDILAKDSNGNYVIIEVKRGIAGRSAVGQVQSYMGSILNEFQGKRVRGLLVAMGLDEAARSALTVTSDIKFFEFRTRFEFECIEISKPVFSSNSSSSQAEVRSGYWEDLGGAITDQIVNCNNCGKVAKVVSVGASFVCGVCGKAVH